MDKATMLYNKFKSMFLVGEGDCVLSQVLNKSLAEQRQHEEAKKGALKRVEQAKENNSGTDHHILSFFLAYLYSSRLACMGLYIFGHLQNVFCKNVASKQRQSYYVVIAAIPGLCEWYHGCVCFIFVF